LAARARPSVWEIGGVLVFDVDGRVGVDLGEGVQDLGPEGDVVAESDGAEFQAGVSGQALHQRP
jgi:hypothetical protein